MFGKEKGRQNQTMTVNILVKSISKGAGSIAPLQYDLPAGINTVEMLIAETVRECLRRYRERTCAGQAGDATIKSAENRSGVPLPNGVSIEDQALSGKIVYGVYSDRKAPDEADAVRNALDAFCDGVTAVFIDGKKTDDLSDQVMLREGSEVMFVRLTPLSASLMLLDWMW